MQNKLNSIKNLIWAFAIVVCLFALFIGFIFTAVQKYNGEKGSTTLDLGQAQTSAKGKNEVIAVEVGLEKGLLNEVPSTQDAGQAYIDSLRFLCDSSLIGLRDYGLLSEGPNTTQVWSTESGVIDASVLSGFMLIYPVDGSEISPASAVMVEQPKILIVSVGSDGLAELDETSFKSGYTSLVQGLSSSSPSTKIICCGLTPILTSYSVGDGLTNDIINSANEWIKQVCTDSGVYYADIASAVSENGALKDVYASHNGKTLNSSGVNQVLQYLRLHAVG